MNPREWDWDRIVWSLWIVQFIVLELLGVFHKVPWGSLSRFSWKLESLSPVLPYVFLIGLAVLLVHIVTGFPGHRPW
jgi:hypothetical protein